MHPVVRTLVKILRETRPVILRPFDKLTDVKIPHDERNTIVERACSKISLNIKDEIKRAYPESMVLFHPLLDPIPTDKDCFVIQPLDGICNYSHALPEFTTAISFMERGKTRHTVILAAITEDYFTATSGEGALWNQRRIKISAPSLQHDIAIALYNDGTKSLENRLLKKLNKQENIRLRMHQAPLLHFCNLAKGAIDCVIALNIQSLETLTPARILVKELGGVFTNLSLAGATLDKNNFIAGSNELVKHVLVMP